VGPAGSGEPGPGSRTSSALHELVTGVVTDVRNTWWSAPLGRGAQLLLSGQDDPQRDPMHLQTPEGRNDAWVTYAHKPIASIATSTELHAYVSTPIRAVRHPWRGHR
jgi:hypothetical protein